MTPPATVQVFRADPALAPWVAAARKAAALALADPGLAHWWRAENTWFVGVDALPNDARGGVDGVLPQGQAVTAARRIADAPWHPLQVSAIRAGYPGSGASEDPAQHRFRLTRDGAHLDGLLPLGPDRRRFLKEPHAFILGIALTDADPGASPLVVWDGSPAIIRDAFTARFAGVPPDAWPDLDVTETYQAARRAVFARCARREVPLRRGEAVLLHRMAIHGIAPWAKGATADPMGRVIAYLRPRAAHEWWLTVP